MKCLSIITHLFLFTAKFYSHWHHTTSLKTYILTFNFHPQGDTTNKFVLVIVQTKKGLYLGWLYNLKFSEMNLHFRGKQTATT